MSRLLLAALVGAGVLLGGCGGEEPKKKKVEIPPPPIEQTDPVAAAKARQLARENAPEPELNPEEPREQFKLVWGNGKKRIRSIHSERVDILAQMKGVKLEGDNKKFADVLAPIMDKLRIWTVGKKPEKLETAGTRLCTLIEEVRGPLQQVIDDNTADLEKVSKVLEEIDKQLEEDPESVKQRTIDKHEEEKKRLSAPVSAAKFGFLAIKSMLEEAYLLADLGPRRAQLQLKECLGRIAQQKLPLDLAEDALDKVLQRTKYYRR